MIHLFDLPEKVTLPPLSRMVISTVRLLSLSKKATPGAVAVILNSILSSFSVKLSSLMIITKSTLDWSGGKVKVVFIVKSLLSTVLERVANNKSDLQQLLNFTLKRYDKNKTFKDLSHLSSVMARAVQLGLTSVNCKYVTHYRKICLNTARLKWRCKGLKYLNRKRKSFVYILILEHTC